MHSVKKRSENSSLFQKIREKVNALKRDLMSLWFAYQDKRTPWYAKLWAAGVVGYAFSPIDLIPDFIPILGYLDDAIILPIGIFIAIRLIPKDVLSESRIKAQIWFDNNKGKPKNWVVAALILLLWMAILFFIFYALLKRFT